MQREDSVSSVRSVRIGMNGKQQEGETGRSRLRGGAGAFTGGAVSPRSPFIVM